MPALMNEADRIERFSLNLIIQKRRERTTTTARITTLGAYRNQAKVADINSCILRDQALAPPLHRGRVEAIGVIRGR